MSLHKYRPDIDGLRAIAIISVVLYHAFPDHFLGGFVGVDIFFVISGYLISNIVFRGLQEGVFSIYQFYEKRIRRIFPALIAVLSVVLMVGWFSLLSDDFSGILKHTFRASTFTSNFLLQRESGYFDVAAETKPLLHLWSLSIEEQFYLLCPILLYMLWKNKKSLPIVLTFLIIASFILNLIYVHVDRSAAFYFPFSRFFELLLGVLFAYLQLYLPLPKIINSLSLPKPLISNVLSCLGVALLGLSFLLINKNSLFPGWIVLMPVFGAIFIILAGPQAIFNKAILSNQIMVGIGLISFPLYLWHWPLLSFSGIYFGGKPPNEILVILLIIALFLAWGTYYFFEKPIRYGFKARPRIVLWGLVLGLVLLGIIGWIGKNAQGYPERFSAEEAKLSSLSWPESRNWQEACRKLYPAHQYCLATNINAPPSAVIIGDSHANHFYWGLSEYYKSHNQNLLNLGQSQCGTFLDMGLGPPSWNCYESMKRIFEYIMHTSSIKTVYLSFHHSGYFSDKLIFNDIRGEIHHLDNYSNVRDGLVRTISELQKSGKKIVLIFDLPDLTDDPMRIMKKCFYANFFTQHKSCDYSDLTFIDDYRLYEKLIIDVQKQVKFEVFRSDEYLKNFPVDSVGDLTYRDRHHLSVKGSLFYADKYQGLEDNLAK